MGMSGDVNGCGLCAKYCLFAANFLIFVSISDQWMKDLLYLQPYLISWIIFRLAQLYCLDWEYGREYSK